MKHLLKSASTLFLLGTAIALSGCVSDNFMTGSITDAPGHGSERYPIVVEKGPQTIEVDAHRGHLTDEQANAVRSFVYQALNARKPITVSYPSSKGPSFQVTGEIAEIMVAQGVSKDRVEFVSYKGSGSDPVRITFISSFAHTRPCGNWTRDLTDTAENNNFENFGCAMQSNIAAEVANPDTFIAPTTPTTRLAGRDVAAVKALESTTSSTSSSSSGSSSSSAVPGSGATP